MDNEAFSISEVYDAVELAGVAPLFLLKTGREGG